MYLSTYIYVSLIYISLSPPSSPHFPSQTPRHPNFEPFRYRTKKHYFCHNPKWFVLETWWNSVTLSFTAAQALQVNVERKGTKFVSKFGVQPIPLKLQVVRPQIWGYRVSHSIYECVFPPNRRYNLSHSNLKSCTPN